MGDGYDLLYIIIKKVKTRVRQKRMTLLTVGIESNGDTVDTQEFVVKEVRRKKLNLSVT